MKLIKVFFCINFIFISMVYSQTYDEIIKLRNQYEQLKIDEINSNTDLNGEALSKDQKNLGLTRVIYKPADLEEFYRIQLSQLAKSLDELKKINSFFDSTKSLSHFGYNIFTNRDTISFFENMPLPSDYALGTGDQIELSLWGEVEKEESSVINRDGNIFFEDIGILSLDGITISQAKQKIKNSFSKTYSTIKGKNPTTFLDISLGQLKGLNIYILGSVKSPGVYALHPFSDPFSALFYSGGIDTTGSLRNIQIFRDGIKINTVDIYSIIHGGTFNKQIRLLDQDVIFVPPRKSKVIVNGEVLIPGYFELIPNETAMDLINYSGGLTSKASSISILKRINSPFTRINDDDALEYFTIPIDSMNNFTLVNGDSLGISSISNYYPTITINGWVKRPGLYPYIKGITLLELIELGGGLYDKSWLLGSDKKIINLIKYDNNGITKSIDLDYNKILSGEENIELNIFDEVQIAKNFNSNFNKFVKLQGEVISEGVYSISKRTINQIINDAGGFTNNALTEGVELHRDSLRVALNSLSIIPIDGDSIYVPFATGSISILGSVNNPGPISFEKNLSVNDFINLAGGFTTYANKRDVFIIYPNGTAKKKTRLNSPKVFEGSTIMVSSNQLAIEQNDYLAITQQIASIIGSLATVALIIKSQ